MVETLYRTAWSLVIVVGVSFAFALLLQMLGAGIRRSGVGRWRRAYWYFVSPGVACHELGHCMGCLVTGTRISKVELFTPNNKDHLGCVWHEVPTGAFGSVKNLIIATGPIWFGCLMIALLSKIVLGTVVAVELSEYVECPQSPGVGEYLMGCFRAGLDTMMGVFLNMLQRPLLSVLWLYFAFCIASEVGLSSVDLSHTWKGIFLVALTIGVLTILPWLGRLVVSGVALLMPFVFTVHAMMAVGLLVSGVMLLLVRVCR